jgi:hypothetical protein
MSSTRIRRHVNAPREIVAVHDRLPPGLSPADNEVGWQSSLAKLAALVEAAEPGASS